MHERIKGYFLTGRMGDDEIVDIVAHKNELIAELETKMRDEEYVPVLDLKPQFTRKFDPLTDGYLFRLTIYGVKEKDSWSMAGISNGTMQKSSTLSRSNLSLSTWD